MTEEGEETGDAKEAEERDWKLLLLLLMCEMVLVLVLVVELLLLVVVVVVVVQIKGLQISCSSNDVVEGEEDSKGFENWKKTPPADEQGSCCKCCV